MGDVKKRAANMIVPIVGIRERLITAIGYRPSTMMTTMADKAPTCGVIRGVAHTLQEGFA